MKLLTRSTILPAAVAALCISLFGVPPAFGFVPPTTRPGGEQIGLGSSPELPSQADFVSGFAAAKRISVMDAASAVKDSQLVVDVTSQYEKADFYGGIAMDYSGGYRIRARATTAIGAETIRRSLDRASGPVEVVVGGASLEELNQEGGKLAALLATSDVAVLIDALEGSIVVRGPESSLKKVPESVRKTVKLEPGAGPVHASTAGPGTTLQRWTGSAWVNDCTVGIAIRRLSDNWPGVVTAGHCNIAQWNPGWTGRTANIENLRKAENRSCGGGPVSVPGQGPAGADFQLHPMTGNSTVSGGIYSIAGGFGLGQPVLRNGWVTSDYTSVAFAQPPGGVSAIGGAQPGSTCQFTYNVLGIQLAPGAYGPVGGDSGGPVLLNYGGNYYFYGITSGGAQGSPGIASGWGAFNMDGWRYCTQTQPC